MMGGYEMKRKFLTLLDDLVTDSYWGGVLLLLLYLSISVWGISSACASDQFEGVDISLDQFHEAIIALTEGESEPYHVISNVEVYEYYSKTVGRHNK